MRDFAEQGKQEARGIARLKGHWALAGAGVCAGALTALSLASCTLALAKSETQREFEKDSAIVAARVARFDGPTPVVQYAYRGRMHEHRVEGRAIPEDLKPDLRTRSLQVRLVRSDPERAYVNAWEEPPGGGLGFAALAAFLGIFSVWTGGAFRRNLARRRMARKKTARAAQAAEWSAQASSLGEALKAAGEPRPLLSPLFSQLASEAEPLAAKGRGQKALEEGDCRGEAPRAGGEKKPETARDGGLASVDRERGESPVSAQA